MSARYAIAVYRIKDAERSQDSTEQISWATNELTSILKEGDPTIIDVPVIWAGLAMAQRAQHEIASVFETGERDLDEAEDRALYTLKKVILLLYIFKSFSCPERAELFYVQCVLSWCST